MALLSILSPILSTSNGNVVGPASATDGHLAVFDGTTGKLIKDGGAVPAAVTPGGSTTQIQYNNAGAFGGTAGATSDGTNVTFGSANLRATRPQFTTSIDTGAGAVIFDVSTANITKTNLARNAALYIDSSGGGVVSIGDVGGVSTGVQLSVVTTVGTTATGPFKATGGSQFDSTINVSGLSTLFGGVLYNASVAAKAATPYTVFTTESGRVFTNEGASAQIEFDLPTAAAGYVYQFIVQDADGIKIVASAGDTIRLATAVSATAGNTVSTTVGSTVTLVAINATEWIATAINGVWVTT